MTHPNFLDQQYENYQFQNSEIEHGYGEKFHILKNPLMLSRLAALCSPDTYQPQVNELISAVYQSLFEVVLNQEFPNRNVSMPTRMKEFEEQGVYQGPVLDRTTKAVTVNLARAGTLPSHLCYNTLNYLLRPENVRQDHISIARQTNADDQVTGSAVSGHKIGGRVDDCILMFPDPMGATGSTIVEAVDLYKDLGTPKKIIAIHCIVTPEYLLKLSKEAPQVIVYAGRLDRGLSDENVLKSVPGSQWDNEKGLNHKHYIVPGGGGLGEVLNNSFV